MNNGIGGLLQSSETIITKQDTNKAITALITAIRAESSSKLEVARRISKAWVIPANKTVRAKADWVDHIAPKLSEAGVDYGYDAARQAVKVGDYFQVDTSHNGLDLTALDYSYLKLAANSQDTRQGAINELVAFHTNGPASKTVKAFGAQLKASNLGSSKSGASKSNKAIVTLTVTLSELLVADFKPATPEERDAFVKACKQAITKAESTSLNKTGPTTIANKPKTSKPASKPNKASKPKASRARAKAKS